MTALAQSLAWPAYVLDAAWTIACANAAARFLLVGLFEGVDEPNLLRYILSSAQSRAQLSDWEMRCQRVLAKFRHDCGRGLGDPRVASVVAWLRATSTDFHAA